MTRQQYYTLPEVARMLQVDYSKVLSLATKNSQFKSAQAGRKRQLFSRGQVEAMKVYFAEINKEQDKK